MYGSEQQIAASEAPRKRGRGKPFVKGDARINRRGVTRESVALAKVLRDTAVDVLFSPSPRQPDKTRLVCTLEALADKAERGDVRAAEVLLERIGGKPTQPIEADVTERGGLVIEWNGPPPPWFPKHALEDYERTQRKKYGNPPTESETKNAQSEAQPRVIEFEAERLEPAQPATPQEKPALFSYSAIHPARIDEAALVWAGVSRN